MFQEVADVFPGRSTKHATSLAAEPRELKIDEGRRRIVAHQYIRLFGQVIVSDASAVNSPQEFRCILEVISSFGPVFEQGCSGYKRSRQSVAVIAYELRDTVDVSQRRQCPRFASHEAAGQPLKPPAGGSGIAQNGGLTVFCDLPDFPKQVFFQQLAFQQHFSQQLIFLHWQSPQLLQRIHEPFG